MYFMWEILKIWYHSLEGQFFIKIVLCIFFWTMLGYERQAKGKDAWIRTYSYVILWAMIFTFLSEVVDPNSTSRIAAQIVTGVWFLWAWLIIKESATSQVRNLTTAASIWYAWGIWMIIWFGYFTIAWLAALATFVLPRTARLINKYFIKVNKDIVPESS